MTTTMCWVCGANANWVYGLYASVCVSSYSHHYRRRHRHQMHGYACLFVCVGRLSSVRGKEMMTMNNVCCVVLCCAVGLLYFL